MMWEEAAEALPKRTIDSPLARAVGKTLNINSSPTEQESRYSTSLVSFFKTPRIAVSGNIGSSSDFSSPIFHRARTEGIVVPPPRTELRRDLDEIRSVEHTTRENALGKA